MSPKKVRPHLSEDIKNRIAGLRQSNLSYKQIFDILKKENVKTSLSAVKRIGQRFEIEGSVRRKSGSGRPRASTVKDDHRLKMTVLKDRKKTYVDHSKEFKTAAGNSLSRMTISRRLNEVGFNSKKCAKKPLFPAIKVLKFAWPIFFVHECIRKLLQTFQISRADKFSRCIGMNRRREIWRHFRLCKILPKIPPRRRSCMRSKSLIVSGAKPKPALAPSVGAVKCGCDNNSRYA